MKFERTAIPEVVLFTPARFGDARGFFSETWTARAMTDATLRLYAGLSPAFARTEAAT